jgi:hypothetical protein
LGRSAGAPIPQAAAVGVADHAGHAILVTVASGPAILDRRRIELVEPGLPTFPIHHQGQWAFGRYTNVPWSYPVSMAEALDLVARVRESAARCTLRSLNDLAAATPSIASISLRACPQIPETAEEQIADARAQTVADSVMYRRALADAAKAVGWRVIWFDRKSVFKQAAAALGSDDIDATLRAMGKAMGPPWQADHKLAAAAALAAHART